MRAEDLLDRLEDRPFRSFRVHLDDGSTVLIDNPGMVIVGPSSAVLPTQFGRDEDGRPLARHCRTIALSHIVQFSDPAERVNGGTKRKK